MAIVTCPECGGQISSTSKTCVHCGCEIVICPKCNQVNRAVDKECTQCGNSLGVETTQKNNSKNLILQNEKQNLSKFAEKFNETYLKIKPVMWLFVFLRIVGLVVFALPLINVISARNSLNYAKMISSYNNFILYAMPMILIESLFWILKVMDNYTNPLKINKINLWMKNQNFELVKALSLYLSNESFTSINNVEKRAIKSLIDARIRLDVSKKKSVWDFTVGIIGVFVSLMLGLTCAIMFLQDTLLDIINLKTIDAAVIAQNINIPLLISVFACLIACVIIQTCVRSSISKDRHAWVKKELPEQYDKYMTYLK